MNIGYFNYPLPVNEPVKSYAVGSEERASVKKALEEAKRDEKDFPAIIGGKEIRSGNKIKMRPPHELSHTLGYFHRSSKEHIQLAIEAALQAKESWEQMNWENRAAIFLKAADLMAGKYRNQMNVSTMLGQSKNIYQAEIDSACELIDFLRFNVHYLSEIYRQQPISSPGMHNRSGVSVSGRIRTCHHPFQFYSHWRKPANFGSHVRKCGCMETGRYTDIQRLDVYENSAGSGTARWRN